MQTPSRLWCVSLPWFVWLDSSGREIKVKHRQVTLISTHAHTHSTVTQTAVGFKHSVSCLVIWGAERLHTLLPAFTNVLPTCCMKDGTFTVFAKGGEGNVCVCMWNLSIGMPVEEVRVKGRWCWLTVCLWGGVCAYSVYVNTHTQQLAVDLLKNHMAVFQISVIASSLSHFHFSHSCMKTDQIVRNLD